MPLPHEQMRWRDETAPGGALTLHLSERDVRVLDEIAIGMYEAHPHDPRAGVVSKVMPSRPAAIRWLIEQHRQRHPPPVRRKPIEWRERLAVFWKLETCWRRARREKTEATPPIPPWL